MNNLLPTSMSIPDDFLASIIEMTVDDSSDDFYEELEKKDQMSKSELI